TENADGEPNHDGHAVLVLKVPPAEVDRVLGNLDATGRVLSMNQSAQDVTDQLIDLDVRIANKRASVENVRTMMEQATDLNQLVTLEAELTWRRTELEQLEAQQRNLSDRVALSTITIEVRPAPDRTPVSPPATTRSAMRAGRVGTRSARCCSASPSCSPRWPRSSSPPPWWGCWRGSRCAPAAVPSTGSSRRRSPPTPPTTN